MISNAVLQWVIVAVLVLLSIAHVLRRFAPGVLRRQRTAIALYLLRPQRGAMARKLGRRIAPSPRQPASACGSGACNTCADARPTSSIP